jgi:two-component sensor histidine kinase
MNFPVRRLRQGDAYSAALHIVFYGLVIAVPLILVLGAILAYSSRLERTQLEESLHQVVSDLVNDLDRDFSRHVTILKTLASSPLVEANDWRAFYDQSKAAVDQRTYIVLMDMEGRQLVNTYVPFGEQPNTTGDPQSIRRIQERPAPLVSNLFTSLVVKRPVFNVVLPITREGRVRYVLALGLLPEDVLTILKSQQLPPQWVTTVWDAEGLIVAQSRDHERYVGKPLPSSLRLGPTPYSVYRTKNVDGEDVLRSVATMEISGWGVAVNVPVPHVEAQLRASLFVWAFIFAMTSALVIWLGYLLGARLTKPLSALSAAAAALGHGHPVEVERSVIHEINLVGEALKKAQQEIASGEAQRRLLVDELSHRVKNTLAIVQAMAVQTMRTRRNPTEFVEEFDGRLGALARAHDLLLKEQWKSASLKQTVLAVVQPFQSENNPVQVTGNDVVVPPNLVITLSLMLHELATNAAKHGSLSKPGGRVDIRWKSSEETGDDRIWFAWIERGGPPVSDPDRQGFGSRMLASGAAQLGADLRVEYSADGLHCTLDFPVPDGKGS